MKIYFTQFAFTFLLLFTIFTVHAQTGNRVFTGAEKTNFITIDLATPGTQSWSTDRMSTPGYFSATLGAIYTGASDASNINGYVKKYGNETYTFPVGDGTDLRTLTISAPATATDAYATAWISGSPSGNLDPTLPNAGSHDITSVVTPITMVSSIGQWDWQVGGNIGATGTGVGLIITVSIPDMTAFSPAIQLRLAGWNGTAWVDLSGGPTASGNTENSTLSGTMIAGITAIGIATTGNILPLHLKSFQSQEKDCAAFLNWATTNELNTDHFEIQQSNDGSLYKTAGIVTAKNTYQENNYSFTINQISGINYYRLKIIDKDGRFIYSPVEVVKSNCSLNKDYIKVYPNPVKKGIVFIHFITVTKGDAKLLLFNSNGQQIISRDINIITGSNKVKLGINNIPPGNYFIQLISIDNKIIFKPQKIIVE
jgi:hypothetical protein